MHQIVFIVFIVVVMFCRMQMIRLRRGLSTEHKAKLFDVPSRMLQYVVYLVILFGGLFTINHFALNGELAAHSLAFYLVMTVWMVLLIGVGMVFRVKNLRRLKAAGFPQSYIRSATIYSSVIYIALIVFFAWTLLAVHGMV